jgi:ribosomal-protein-alanine N-acetyltransferase
MLTVNFSPFPFLSTDRLLLREVSEDDADEIFFLRSDERVLQYLGRAPAQTTEEALAFIKMIKDQRKNNESILWAITLKEDNKLIGTICFWNIAKEHYRSEIGYVLHPDFCGKGIMNEALAAVLNYGFNAMKLHSVEANVNPENIPSIKLLLRHKFIREGYFKENYFFNGRFSDSVVYSLLNKQTTSP